MSEFKPSFPFSTPMDLLIPSYTMSKGVPVKAFPNSGIRINASFKTYGGTEMLTNDLYTVIDTAVIETWYRPDIKPDCRVRLFATGQVYEIIGQVENVDMRNQFCKFKVRAVEGCA